MANLTDEGHHNATRALFCSNVLGIHHNIFLLAFNIPLSIAASLGNALILIALHKDSSLHRPSKFMFRCLAVTDLCVGIISQPVFAAELIFETHDLQHLCYQFSKWGNIISIVFSGVSLMTVTAISVDRLLALSLGLRYRQVVTLKRVRAIISGIWLGCIAVSLMKRFWSAAIFSRVMSITIILCLVTSAFCYTRIFFLLRHHQVQIQGHVDQEQTGGGVPPNIARYRKTVSAALWVQMTLVACYLPQALMFSIGSSFSIALLIVCDRYTLSLVYLNSSLNPILYCWKIREVRQAVKETIRQMCFLSS